MKSWAGPENKARCSQRLLKYQHPQRESKTWGIILWNEICPTNYAWFPVEVETVLFLFVCLFVCCLFVCFTNYRKVHLLLDIFSRSHSNRAKCPRSEAWDSEETVRHSCTALDSRPLSGGPYPDIWTGVWASHMLKWQNYFPRITNFKQSTRKTHSFSHGSWVQHSRKCQ